MKHLLYLVTVAILFVFAYSCSTSMPMNEDKEEIADNYYYSTTDAEQGIDSTVLVVMEGEVYEEVYYTNGDIEVFSSYLNIKDIGLRKAYIIYRSVYWDSGGKVNIKDLIELSEVELDFILKEDKTEEEVLLRADYLLFNKFLILDGKKALKYNDFMAEIKGEQISNRPHTTLFLVIIFLLVLLFLGMANVSKRKTIPGNGLNTS